TTAAPAPTTAAPGPSSEEDTSEPVLIQYTTITVHSSEADSSIYQPAPTTNPTPSYASSAGGSSNTAAPISTSSCNEAQPTAIPAPASGPAAAPAGPNAGYPAAPGYTTAGHARKNTSTKARVAPKRIRRRIRHIIRNRGHMAKKVRVAKAKETTN
ncbi:hypothetical protein IWW56_004234, partial [Coemansia sp. RSA 2131]